MLSPEHASEPSALLYWRWQQAVSQLVILAADGVAFALVAVGPLPFLLGQGFRSFRPFAQLLQKLGSPGVVRLGLCRVRGGALSGGVRFRPSLGLAEHPDQFGDGDEAFAVADKGLRLTDRPVFDAAFQRSLADAKITGRFGECDSISIWLRHSVTG